MTTIIRPPASRSPRRGYSLPLVLVLVVLLGISFATALGALQSSVAVTSDMISRRQAFYACDGLSRDIAFIAQNYLSTTTNPTSAGMQDFICQRAGSAAGCAGGLPTLTPPGFTTDGFSVALAGTPAMRPLPNGTFAGMNALQSDISLRVSAQKNNSNARCDTSQTLTLGAVGMFQFFVFSDLKLTWYPDPESVVRGRMHVNADVCVSSTAGGMYLQNLTTSGRAMSGRNPQCLKLDDSGSKVWVWRGGTSCPDSNFPGTDASRQPLASGPSSPPANSAVDACYVELVGSGTEKNDHATIPPSATGFATWADYALATWNRHVLDVDHGVPSLVLPVQSTAQVQPGRLAADASADAAGFSNSGTSRIFVDPVMPADDPFVAGEKLACKADLRIINGVWFVKGATSSADPCGWPGLPIWSDHPGSYTILSTPQPTERLLTTEVAVGQADLRTARGWDASTNAEQIPKFFSYYRFGVLADSTYGELIYDTTQAQKPVISYGALKNLKTDSPDDADAVFDAEVVPANWADDVNTGSAASIEDLRAASLPAEICGATRPSAAAAGTGNDKGVLLSVFDTSCGGTLPAAALPIRHKLLDAARTGFLDSQIMIQPAYEDENTVRMPRSRVLPINFDVRAFRAALKTCTKGELGSYFSTTCNGSGARSFNGIVYITNTWNRSLDGFGTVSTFAGGAAVWPQQGKHENAAAALPPNVPTGMVGGSVITQPNQASRFTSAVARPSLPYQLCTTDVGLVRQGSNPPPAVARGGFNVWQAEMVRPSSNSALPFRPFKHVPCSDWNVGPDKIAGNSDDVVEGGARANVVRVIHAGLIGNDTVTTDPLKKGLTVATNIPSYIWGDINDSSVPSLQPVATPPTPWVPFLITGDQVRFLSRNWDDAATPWGRPSVADNQGTAGGKFDRQAVATVYTLQNFSGHPQAFGDEFNGGFENFPGFLEDWKDIDATVNGSFVVGFSPVYLRTKHNGQKVPPNRPWSYDHHLDFPANQPPGGPRFEVFAIKDWTR